MNIALLLYAISLMNAVSITMTAFFMIFIVMTSLLSVVWLFTSDDNYHKTTNENITRILKWIAARYRIFLAILVFSWFIPEKSTMYILLYSWYMGSGTHSPRVTAILDLNMDKIINSLQKEKKDDK